MSGTKYRGSASYAAWIGASGTINLTSESRTITLDQTANQIDVTVRGDTAKAFLTDFPEVTFSINGLDTAGTTVGGTPGTPVSQPWDQINIGDLGTILFGPEGSVTGYRKKTLPAICKSKKTESPYDGVVTWDLQFSSNGGSVANTTW